LLERANLSGVIDENQKSKMRVIPNPIDINYFRSAISIERLEALESFGLNPNIPTLMFSAANLTNPAKGFHEFKEICKLLKSEGKEIQALVIGDSRSMELDLEVPMKHLGFVSDLSILRMAYWSSSIYVTTSHEENLPTTIMESLACGIPVAAFSVGGIPEMIVENETGYLAEKLDSANLANAISKHLSLNEESMKNICNNLKRLIMHPTLHSLILALTAIYLMFGVLNAGFIMVQVLANLIDFFFHHSFTHGDVISMGLGRIILR
jgi:glycosyltransferase involved in cell wall biosynthesis